ncbi:Angiotensin-converting enzyme [Gryllus bimaculatus]|nr:Angiotensin-converting enzyme [Gryllus bimaculatus]
MTSTYSTAKICPYKKQACALNEMLSLDPGMEEIISKSRDYDELTYVWKAWRDASGKLMRENYKKYVQLNNKAAKMNGFEDMGEMWRHDYDSETLKEEMLDLWETIEPLYVQLHKYVRTKLEQHYGEKLAASDGLLPAHVLGNMWAQSWGNIFDLVKPFPEGSAVNVTQSLIDQGYDALRMFKTSDDFYISLGLANNSVSYGKDAMLVRPTDREVVCHASAWDFCNGKDYRKGANPGFHEAIGDTIALSVSTPKHLKEVGLLGKDYPDTEEDNINALMAMALDKVAFLPFGLLIDMWRWDVFSGNVTSDQWNEHWWYLRKTIQRIKPPVPRNEEDFDPGAKFHVPGDSQYIAKGLQLGGSTHWRDALEAITGQREYSGEPLLEYFKPLYDFLVSENTKSEGKDEVIEEKPIEDKPIEEQPKGDVEESVVPAKENVVPAKENEVPSNGLSSQDSAVKDVKGPEETKSQEPTDQTVPIVVGCVLGALLVCILIGYVIFRRRAAKRSADIPSTTGSKALP